MMNNSEGLANSLERFTISPSRQSNSLMSEQRSNLVGRGRIQSRVVLGDARTVSARESLGDTSSSFIRATRNEPINPAPTRLPKEFIAHSTEVQEDMDSLDIAWGVQYEIARGITSKAWKWEDVTREKLERLTGTNANSAPKVREVMLGVPARASKDLKIWEELDREHRASMEQPNLQRSLGMCGDWEQETDWYGGRVVQIARLVQRERNSPFEVQLEPCEYQLATTRFARFLGSRRVLRMSIPLYSDGPVRNFLTKKFVLCGRIFIPLKPKEGKVYLVEIDEDHERSILREDDNTRLPFEEIANWHNPMDQNSDQPIRKWVSRFDLGFSTTIPVIEFKPEDIIYIHDEYVSDYDPAHGKPAAEQITTDGCGFMNRAALIQIAGVIQLNRPPTVVQGRIAGAKGIWILHPDFQHDTGERAKIWIRDSQNKIKLTGSGRAHLIFELVSPDCLTYPARLSKQVIVNLHHNGVPEQVFENMMSDGIEEDFKHLTTWEGPNATKSLLHSVARVGNLSGIRLRREFANMARAFGHGRERETETPLDSIGFDEDEVASPGRTPFSNEPTALCEKIFEMIAAGFHPARSPTLNQDLRQFIKTTMEGSIVEFRILNPKSAEAFIIPDPFHVLPENTIYFRSWDIIKNPLAETDLDTLSGRVLINRHPTLLASDIQIVTAMDDPGFHETFKNYRNVIVCSSKGDRSFASKLSGGDYDGDTAMLIWNAEIVSAFVEPELSYPPDHFMEDNFEQEVDTVAQLMSRLSSQPNATAENEFRQVFLVGVEDNKVGRYSNFHDKAVYKNGYNDPRTIRLKHMFNTLIDVAKTGRKVRHDVFVKDDNTWRNPLPDHLKKPVSGFTSQDNRRTLTRSSDLPPFILETLGFYGRGILDKNLIYYQGHCELSQTDRRIDPDISSVFADAWESGILLGELRSIKHHVDRCIKACPGVGRNSLKQLRRKYHEVPEGVIVFGKLRLVERLKASYAYSQKEKFAFAVAYSELCSIKASAMGLAPIAQTFADVLGSVPGSFARIWARN